jgi:hypothetical protein
MIRLLARRALALAIAVSLSTVGCAGAGAPASDSGQTKPPAASPAKPAPSTPDTTPAKPDQPVNPDAKALAGFLDRVNEYVKVHQKLEAALPHLPKEATPQQIDKNQRALGALIQDARRTAKQGDIFTPESQVVMKRLLAKVFGGPDGAALKASIMDENPGVPRIVVNARYPDAVPLSTIPPQVLQGMPKLPEEMEFRFIGNTLVLMDVHAHIIADYVPDAFPHRYRS